MDEMEEKKLVINGKNTMNTQIKRTENRSLDRKVCEQKRWQNVDSKIFEIKRQIEMVNKMQMNQNNNKMSDEQQILQSELQKKLQGQRQQDIQKGFCGESGEQNGSDEQLITIEELLEKLVVSRLRCSQCKKSVKVLQKEVRDKKQWTLDRVDNEKGHLKDNIVICCLECNLRRRTQSERLFRMSKEMKFVKSEE